MRLLIVLTGLIVTSFPTHSLLRTVDRSGSCAFARSSICSHSFGAKLSNFKVKRPSGAVSFVYERKGHRFQFGGSQLKVSSTCVAGSVPLFCTKIAAV